MAATTLSSSPTSPSVSDSQQQQQASPAVRASAASTSTSTSSASSSTATTTDSKQSLSANVNGDTTVTSAVPGVVDVFDALLNMESDFIAEGAARGERDGLRQGFFEGRAMGVEKGSEYGQELGFYAGSIATWRALAAQHPTKFTPRGRELLDKCHELLESYPLGAIIDDGIERRIEVIRSRYKQLLSALGVQSRFRRQADTSLSF